MRMDILKHDDVIKWKHFSRYWPFVGGIPRGALMFSLICARMNGWVNNREAGDLRRHRFHYDVIVMSRMRALSHYPQDRKLRIQISE